MRHELYHPVTEDAAREFIQNTAPSDTTDAEHERRVQDLLRGASENRAWRDSRDPVERMELSSVPFAVHETEPPADDETSDSEEEGGDSAGA